MSSATLLVGNSKKWPEMNCLMSDLLERPITERNEESAGTAPLLDLLEYLRSQRYEFVTPTPSTHARVVARPDHKQAETFRDVLGWSLPFAQDLLPPAIFDILSKAGVLTRRADGRFTSSVRVSTFRGMYFLHSAYPTLAEDSVFLGPDSYRFADHILANIGALNQGARILDYATGAGIGGITAALSQRNALLALADINPKALILASVNADFNGATFETVEARCPSEIKGDFDVIVTHPPFMMDREQRAYRDGGDMYGAQLTFDWVCKAMPLLRPGGKLILHTGVSIVGGQDVLLGALNDEIPADGWNFEYHELDADIFGDELDQPAYAKVERIAAVGLVLTKSHSEMVR